MRMARSRRAARLTAPRVETSTSWRRASREQPATAGVSEWSRKRYAGLTMPVWYGNGSFADVDQ